MSTTQMNGTAVSEVANLAQQALEIEPRFAEINGEVFSTSILHRVKPDKEAEPAALVVHTLTGLLDYIEANRDALDLSGCLVHVVDPGHVELRGALLGPHRQRLTFVRAEHFDRFAAFPSFAFGRYLSTEDLIIALQALFEDTEDRATVLQLVGGVASVNATELSDDGVTQHVDIRQGVHRTKVIEAPKRLTLRPFRTFPEVNQPDSVFFLRLKDGGDGVRAALFEADGGAWRLDAIGRVDDYLSARLQEAGINSADSTTLAVIA